MSAATGFWDRRRAAVQEEATADALAVQNAEKTAQAEALADRSDDEILAEMGLPHPSEMKQGDDFSAFLSQAVPEHLRRQALRTLWRSDPVLACVDGLNDYDDDYRAAMLLQEPVKTAYRVGKGMLKHIEEMEMKAKAPEKDAESDCEAPSAVEIEEDNAFVGAETDPMDSEVVHLTDDEAAMAAEVDGPAPRHMRFRFQEAPA